MIHSRYCKIAAVFPITIMFLLFVVSITTMAKSAPFSTHDTSLYQNRPATPFQMNTLDYNIFAKATQKEQTGSILGKKHKFYIAHYTQYARRRLRRSYQQSHNQNDDGNKSRSNNDNANIEHTSNDNNSGNNLTVLSEDRKSSPASLHGSTSLHNKGSKNIDLHGSTSTQINSDTIKDANTLQTESKTRQPIPKDTKSDLVSPTEPEDVLIPSYQDSHLNPTLDPKTPDMPEEGPNIGGIVVVSIVSIVLSSSIFASNLLVMIPFSRCTRIRTPSNFLLLILSLSDFIVGIFVIPLVTITTVLRYLILYLALIHPIAANIL